ncbi:zona pellucida sperm-binding protein 1 isoform X1 [Coturnix japonica]|uniref:zona pellucida sperm-binding protein 1 isoform X1 n=1 Tax=Coturnix japonica TaxID=93934 RepID=UPI000777521B|nr:zona pellucida sperm-binding protein 1 isoform X1 [Coturnix japonica]
MGWSCSLLLPLLLLLPVGLPSGSALLRYRYDCGDFGMQLLAFPMRGRTVRFKVLDEFGTRFEVANCSICLHWLSTGEDGGLIFSAGYEGCHVLVKDSHYVLRVQLEEMLLSGVMAASYEVNMTCPRPAGYEILRNEKVHGHHQPDRGDAALPSHGADVLIPQPPSGSLQHIAHSSLAIPHPQLPLRPPIEQSHPVAHTQPILGHQELQGQPHPGMGHPRPQPQNQPGMTHASGQTHMGLLRPGLQSQNQPEMVHAGGQIQAGVLRPGLQSQNQHRLLNAGSQTQLGVLRPGLQTPNQHGLAHPGSQTQPGVLRPGLQTQNQHGLVLPGSQTQPGVLRPGLQTQNQHGLVLPGSQTQPGVLRPGLQSQSQHGLVHPGSEIQPGVLRPGLQSSNQHGLVRPGSEIQPGVLRPGLQSQSQHGLVHPGVQTQLGVLRPGLQLQNQPGLVHASSQTQAGLFHSGLQHPNQPSLVQPGLQPSLMHTSTHTQAGFFRPGLQPQGQLGLLLPSLQSHSQGSLTRPSLQSQAGLLQSSQPRPGLLRPGLPPRPGLVSPGLQSQAQAGLLHPTALFYPSPGAVLPAPGEPLTREQCQVAAGRLSCVSPPGRDACLQAGCCFDDTDRTTPCYYGNTATVQCLPEGHFVLVVPRGLSAQPYNLDSVRLASTQPGCQPTQTTDAFVLFHFPVTQCGTTVQVMEDRLVYENQLISTIDVQPGPRGSVTRDSVYILHARCIYNATELLPLSLEVAVPPTAAPLAQPGPLQLQLRIATDESYSSYHPDADYPLVKVLRDPIYVEVRLLQKTDPNLVLVLHQCWAAPSTSPAAEPQWPILVDGCPFAGDNYRTQLVPVGPATLQMPFPSHYQRFAISTFAFVDSPATVVLEGEVYIQCSASVCHLAQPEPCRPSCQVAVPSRARRAARDRKTADILGTVTSGGHIVLPKRPTARRH